LRASADSRSAMAVLLYPLHPTLTPRRL